MDNNQAGENKGYHGWHCYCGSRSGVGFGVLLLVIGGYFLLQDLGYISSSVSFWPLAIAAFGLYFIIKGLLR